MQIKVRNISTIIVEIIHSLCILAFLASESRAITSVFNRPFQI